MSDNKKEIRLSLISEWLTINYLNHGRLRCNAISGRIQVATDLDNSVWIDVVDREFNSMVIDCSEDLERNISPAEFQTVLDSKRIPLVNPIHDYIHSLPPYSENEPDWITRKANEITLLHPEQRERFIACFTKWIVAMVACWMDDNVANHQVLVLVGPQGSFKSSWLNTLLPEPLRVYQNNLVLNGMGKVDDDVRNMLYENAIVNLDELDAMGNTELNQIKSLITCQVITNRAKYQRFKSSHVRIASLCGSTNKTHFLTDLTGSRRWMPFEVSAIVNPYENIFPLDRMYAQAYHLYRSGLEYWMTPEDNAVLNQHNEDFRVQDSMEELLHLWFDQPASNCGTFMTSAEIGDFLINQGSIKRPMSSQALSILLKKAGFQPTRKKINGNQIRGFLVYKRERDEVDRIKRDIVTSANPSDIPTN